MKMMYARDGDGKETQMHSVDFDDIVAVFKKIDATPGWSFGKALYHAINGVNAVLSSMDESWRQVRRNEVELTVSWNGQRNKKFICWLG